MGNKTAFLAWYYLKALVLMKWMGNAYGLLVGGGARGQKVTEGDTFSQREAARGEGGGDVGTKVCAFCEKRILSAYRLLTVSAFH